MQLRITSRKKLTSLLCALGLISIVAIYPRQTVNFFYSTAVQITDYIHFYGYRPVKSFAIRIPASYTIHGIDVSRWQERIDWQRVAKMRDNGIRLQFAFIKATEGEKLVDPYFSRNWQLSRENGLLRGMRASKSWSTASTLRISFSIRRSVFVICPGNHWMGRALRLSFMRFSQSCSAGTPAAAPFPKYPAR